MRKIRVKGWEVEVEMPEVINPERLEDLGNLMNNHEYNISTDWEKYRTVGKKLKRRKRKAKQ